MMKIKRALISVSDKTGLKKFVKALKKLGIEILSTGGTAKAIKAYGVPVKEISTYTGFPEMLDGRVKTLHPKIHAGLLALRNKAEHMQQLKEKNILPIDMVVVNLYPFEETLAKKGVSKEKIIENIDIGGPSMLRSAAKNFQSVAVVSSPEQYNIVLEELKKNGCQLKESTLRELAREVFVKTSRYDGVIGAYLKLTDSGSLLKNRLPESVSGFPERIDIALQKICDLRYGENPHQRGALYRDLSSKVNNITDAEQIQGKELSFNNILDISTVFTIVRSFKEPASAIVKHNSPCGIAVASSLEKAYIDALECDRLSAFGGIIGFNKPVTGSMAETILGRIDFVECIIAPAYEPEALGIFREKKNLRILKVDFSSRDFFQEKDMKKIPGGMLVQDADIQDISSKKIKVVTKIKPPKKLKDSLMFAWKAVRFVKSNAIVLCQGTKTVGIGTGQPSRIDSVIIAIRKAGKRAKGSVLASDAFFPKPDSIEEAHKAGIAAIIQPGGSIHDEEIIAACNRFNIPMAFSGIRHFRH